MRDARTEAVRAEAVGTLAAWINGYSVPDEGPQLRFRLVTADDDHVHVRVEECDPFPTNPREYRVTVKVEAL
ncbi:hypothetical protein AB0K92_16030 [Streptomyces sp. NPDC052687]|uniref:hypothetical protein n=1 Tax=Streptomyces sp. NPDC052687 TaxID=3154759 RepID=UPI00342A4F33